ncbi:MAG: hypothetical protein AAF564_20045 [Bacteroidota bacterium]
MYSRILGLLGLLTFFAAPAFAQFDEDLYLSGYFQGQYKSEVYEVAGVKRSLSTFSLQQINFLFKKNFGDRFSSFIDLESVNTYTTEKGWGAMKFSEAWLSFNPKRSLNIKLGLQVPVFNNLNDIKNRTPLLPYLFRPVVYESSFNNFLQITAFVPDQAYINVEGTLVSNRLKFDYAVYMGNETEFVPPDALSLVPASTDTTKSKLFGGRIGIRRGELKAGISATRDHTNQQQGGLGAVRRHRIGADLSFSIRAFFVESELISLLHNLTDAQTQTLTFVSAQSPVLNASLDKLFYYFMLGYRLNDRFTLYASYDHLEDHATVLIKKGVDIFSFGVAFRPIDSAVLKLQYIDYYMLEKRFPDFRFRGQSFFTGVSVIF